MVIMEHCVDLREDIAEQFAPAQPAAGVQWNAVLHWDIKLR